MLVGTKMISSNQYYVLQQRCLWGDYGFALISGYAYCRGPERVLHLKRTGPFLPPISFPRLSTEGRIPVVSTDFRAALERVGFPNLVFRPIVFDRIVKIQWNLWDLGAEEPAFYPLLPSPLSYIDDNKNDEILRRKMETAYEVIFPIIPTKVSEEQKPNGAFTNHYIMTSEKSDYPPVFRSGEKYGQIVVNDFAKAWLESAVGEWVHFAGITRI
jgi:hypothetical protein